MKKHFKAIELKHLDEETIMNIREWRNQPFVKKMMYSQHDITKDEHQKYIENLLKDENRGLFVFYLDDEPFGVYQYKIHPEQQLVENGNYLISEKYQDLGFGVLLSYFQQEICFRILNCNQTYGEVLEFNSKVISMNKKMGGHLSETRKTFRNERGEFIETYHFIIYAEDWNKNKDKLKKLVQLHVEDFNCEKDIIF